MPSLDFGFWRVKWVQSFGTFSQVKRANAEVKSKRTRAHMAALAHFQRSDSGSMASEESIARVPAVNDRHGDGALSTFVLQSGTQEEHDKLHTTETSELSNAIAATMPTTASTAPESDADKKKGAQLGRELFVFTAQKAGMKDVDKERVQKVVYDMSKDSKFFRNSMKQNQKVDLKIQDMRKQLVALSDHRREQMQKRVDNVVVQLEATRDLTRTIVVVDMDMFYAAVEMRDDPALRDVPLAVGGMGMICTTNYIARKFGVRAAMPGFIGKELCPELVFVSPNFEKYTAIATQIREIFADYDPHFSVFSLDEARLDITEYMEAHWHSYCSSRGRTDAGSEDEEEKNGCDSDHDDDGSGEDEGRHIKRMNEKDRVQVASAIVDEIRRKICLKTELTASAGIAANTMLAKIASDMNKPNGQFVLPFTRESVVSFIQRQPVRKIGGIGKVMEKILAAIDITTGKDLFTHRAILFHLFSEKTAPWLLRTSLAIQEVREATERKSFSRERTFHNMSDSDKLEKMCLRVCGYLAEDMQEAGVGARNLTLKLKCADFSVRTRSVSFVVTLKPTKDELFAKAVEILRKELPLTLRLMGVRASSLVSLSGGHGYAAEEGGRSNKKRQLGIDHFARVRFTGSTLDANDIEQPQESAESAEEDRERANELHGATAKTKKKRIGSMANFVTSISKDSTPDIVAALLEANSSSSRHASDFENTDAHSESEADGDPSSTTGTTVFDPVAASFQPCPICGSMINVSNTIAINTHVDACILRQSRGSRPNSSSNGGAAAGPGHQKVSVGAPVIKSCFQPCPICGEMINASNSKLVNTHIDACILSQPDDEPNAATAVDEDDNEEEEDEKGRCGVAAPSLTPPTAASSLHPCPICGTGIDASDDIAVNAHIDACVQRSRVGVAPHHIRNAKKKQRQKGEQQQQHSIQAFFSSN